jgi:uncharacterized protein YqhQ
VPDAPIGGQAVLEGVMMRGVRTWAVAMRLPDDDIELHSFELESRLRGRGIWRLPVVRGVVALVESLRIGIKALKISTDLQMGEEDEEISGPQWALAVVLGLLLAVVLFFVVPVGVTSLFKDQLGSSVVFWLVEGLLRTAIFLGYLVAVTRQRDLRRLFEYHGAEHKTIACHEAGQELTPENAQTFSRLHPRCGTSFLLIVMIVAIFAFAPIGLPAWYWLIATRVLGIPLIAGISFEIIKLTGKHRDARWAKVVMWPGMQLQRLTTREPDHAQLDVAIAALEAVLEAEQPGQSADDLVGYEVVA